MNSNYKDLEQKSSSIFEKLGAIENRRLGCFQEMFDLFGAAIAEFKNGKIDKYQASQIFQYFVKFDMPDYIENIVFLGAGLEASGGELINKKITALSLKISKAGKFKPFN
jgi:hypothetical protein